MQIRFAAGSGRSYEVARGRLQPAAPGRDRLARPGRGGLRRRQRAHGEGDARRRHDLRCAEAATSSRCPATRTCTRWCSSGLYPTDTQQYEELRDALEKLQLNDASLHYEPETSTALGFGFRCGFLGLLHMEIVQERLEREFDLDLVTTVPSVEYHVYRTDGTMELLENPRQAPRCRHDRAHRGAVREGAHHGAGRVHRTDHDARHRAPRRSTRT